MKDQLLHHRSATCFLQEPIQRVPSRTCCRTVCDYRKRSSAFSKVSTPTHARCGSSFLSMKGSIKKNPTFTLCIGSVTSIWGWFHNRNFRILIYEMDPSAKGQLSVWTFLWSFVSGYWNFVMWRNTFFRYGKERNRFSELSWALVLFWFWILLLLIHLLFWLSLNVASVALPFVDVISPPWLYLKCSSP